jgi:hypothetical protein
MYIAASAFDSRLWVMGIDRQENPAQSGLSETGRNDKYRFVHRSGDGLVFPAFPAMLPLAAVKFERNDD